MDIYAFLGEIKLRGQYLIAPSFYPTFKHNIISHKKI